MSKLPEMPDTIVCEDVFLEKISFLHLEKMYEVVQDNLDYLAPWVPFVQKINSVDKQYTYIEDCLSGWDDGKRYDFSIYDKKEDLFLGVASIIVTKSKTGIYELGYWIRKDFQGQGIISDVTNTLSDLLFKEFDANRLMIKSVSNNIGSMKVALKSGFLFSHKDYCQSIIDGKLADTLVFVKLKDEEKIKELQQGQQALKKVFKLEI